MLLVRPMIANVLCSWHRRRLVLGRSALRRLPRLCHFSRLPEGAATNQDPGGKSRSRAQTGRVLFQKAGLVLDADQTLSPAVVSRRREAEATSRPRLGAERSRGRRSVTNNVPRLPRSAHLFSHPVAASCH